MDARHDTIAEFQWFFAAFLLMKERTATRNQRGALTQAGAGIAALRRNSGDFAWLSHVWCVA
jgi:hypothetical protein